ncbi:MAG: protein tyrosine phosphatase [Phycisphaerae bacterium]|nr:protein tyrosine phosphatase [Phycisphaerae bacterium]
MISFLQALTALTGRGHPAQQFTGVDLHCHVLPGLDDGPASEAESLALCRALVADGVHTVVATPHQLGKMEQRYSALDIRQAVTYLRTRLQVASIPLEVVPGAEVRIHEGLPGLIDEDEVLTLADRGRWVLIELPRLSYIEPLPLIRQLKDAGIRSIIAHPERHVCVQTHPHVIRGWIEAGACIQVTATSLLDRLEEEAYRCAWRMVAEVGAVLIASDAHDADRRRPRLSEAFRAVALRMGERVARRVCIDHPADVLAGQALRPVFETPARQEASR